MPGAREIKRRIRSIGSTKKITRAMQMVSAAKMRRAQTAVAASRPYAVFARELAVRINEASLAAAKAGKVSAVGIVVVTPNRGQVGALNSNVVNAARNFAADLQKQGKETAFMAMGKKARDGVMHLGFPLQADFIKADKNISIADIRPLALFIAEKINDGTFSAVHIAYPKFVSTLSQKAVIEQVLPFEIPKDLGTDDLPQKNTDYLFEPNRKIVLDALLPRITEAHIYRAVLEANASEHSARMVMMKNATEAAGDLVDELTLSYNRLRQANITKELAEITAGRIAME